MVHQTWCALIAGLVGLQLLCGAAGSFNYEVARRTIDNIDKLLSEPRFPLQELVHAVKFNFFDYQSPTLLSDLRKMQYPQLLAFNDSIDMLFAGFETGAFSGYLANSTYMSSVNSTALCGATAAPCVNFSHHTNGIPSTSYFANPTDIRAHDWYVSAKTVGTRWVALQVGNSGLLGFTISMPLVNSSGAFVGAVAANIGLGSLDDFLFEAFNDETDNRVVYIVDISGYLVATSLANVTNTFTGNGWARTAATEASNDLIRQSAVFLTTVAGDSFSEDQLLVHGDFFVQVAYYMDSGLEWRVVVVWPTTQNSNYIERGSAAFVVVTLGGIIFAMLTLCLAGFVIRFRTLHLWKAAQPEALMLILTANFMCVCNAFVLTGAPSSFVCGIQRWWVTLSITFTMAAFVAKLMRVYWIMSAPLKLKTPVSAWHTLLFVCVALFLQCVVLMIWELSHPSQTKVTNVVGTTGVTQTKTCDVSGFGFIGVSLVVLSLGLIGCWLAYKARNMSEAFAESKALMFTFYHGLFLTVMLVLVGLFAQASANTITVFLIIAMLWFTATTQAALFLPRIYRQLTRGDFTDREIRDKMHQFVQANHRTQSSTPHENVVWPSSPRNPPA